ncbi:MAG: hypothetical protein Q9205_006483, partial [Flavoplaca limonia]
MHTSTLLGAVLAAGSILCRANAQVTTECDPTKVTCPNDQGLSTDTYSIDFATIKTLSPEWQLANYANVSLGDQGAELTFAKRYDAPTMWTKFKFFFGRVEFVVKAAPGVGIISSTVLLSDDLDEIDWEFLGGVTTNVQTNYFGKGYTGTYNRSTSPAVESPQTQFHTYALDWTTEALTWSIDGVVVRTLKAADADGNGDQYPQTPMKVSLSLWDGGDPDSPTKEWAGGVTPIPPPEPYTMYVKSVKIFNQNPAQQYQYTDKSGSWRSIKVINDIPFSNSSSAAATMAYSLNLGSTSAIPSSQAPQSSEAMSSMSSMGSTSTSAASQHSSGQQSGSSETTVAAGSTSPKETQAYENTVPIVTVLSTSTSTLTSCSSKSNCPTNSKLGSSIATPVVSSSTVKPVGSSSSASESLSTTRITSTVAKTTQTSTSTLPSSMSGSSSSAAASASSSASVAHTSSSSTLLVARTSTTMTLSPYPPSSAASTGNLRQSPSASGSPSSSQDASSSSHPASSSSQDASSSHHASSTASIASSSSSMSSVMPSSNKSSTSIKTPTSESHSSIHVVPAASTATVTATSTASCTDKSSHLGLTPAVAVGSGSTWTTKPLSTYSFTSVILSTTTSMSDKNWSLSTPTPTVASSWASKPVPSGPSTLISTHVTSPSVLLIPLKPNQSIPQTPPTINSHNSPPRSPPASPPSPLPSPPPATLNTNEVISLGSLTAWGLSTSTSSTSPPLQAKVADKTMLSTNTANLATTTTASFPRLMFPPAPGYDADTADNNDWLDEDAEMDMQMPPKPSSSVASPAGADANGGGTNGMSESDPIPLAPDDAESVADTNNMNANEETITDSIILSKINFDPTDETMQTDNINIMAGSSAPPSAPTTPSPSFATTIMPPTAIAPTIQMKKPWKSSIAVHNGTAVLHNRMKPSIASMSGAWITPSGAAGAGNANGSMPFRGAAHTLSVPSGVYIWGL